jgi:AcrR family transcriptional regulator
MPGDRTGREGSGALRAGSPHKRAAIVQAALDIFVRDGYARASVDAIAAQARVSKRTIYDYYGDKRSLFLAAIGETSAAQAAAFADLLERTLTEVTDVPAALTAFGREFAHAVADSPERTAIMRLVNAEAPHFAELRSQWQSVGPVQQALADRLAEFAERGDLEIADPVEAAEHLGVLITGPVNNRSLYGAIALDGGEIDRMATAAVRVFLRAYRATR